MTATIPPHDLAAEEALLGAMLLSRDAIASAVEVCEAKDFYRPAHGHIFQAICALYAKGEPADPVTVADELRRTGLLEAAGGPGNLVALQANTPVFSHADAYARIVSAKAADRGVLSVAAELERAVMEDRRTEAVPAVVDKLLRFGNGGPGSGGLVIEDLAVVDARVSSRPTVRWLARAVLPADAHTVLASPPKDGKTWAVGDLSVAVGGGGEWLGAYPVETQGPVLLFLGEGGERKMTRRLRAIAESKGIKFEDLPIRLCLSAPRLSSAAHLAQIRAEILAHKPVLVVVDPLYLAAAGASGSDLYAMGDVLSGIQAVCQEGGAALVVVTHWNKTGEGHGAHRMTGAGPAEWGRVLVSMSVEHSVTEPDRSTTATLRVTFEGDEIAETELRLRRRIWADDPDDLSSALHYEVEVLAGTSEEATPGTAAMRPAERRVLAVLRAADDWLNVTQIGDLLAADDSGIAPLKRRTIQAAARVLADAGLVRVSDLGTGSSHAQTWRAHEPDLEAENAS